MNRPVKPWPKPPRWWPTAAARGLGRHALARAIGREPTLSKSWLRSLVTGLNGG